MALHTELPVYQDAYALFGVVTDLVKHMPRDYKHSIGGKLRDECVEILVLIFRANVYQDKADILLALIERLEVAELLLRLSRDKHLISTGQYAQAAQITAKVGKQAGGWRRKHQPPVSERSRPL